VKKRGILADILALMMKKKKSMIVRKEKYAALLNQSQRQVTGGYGF
jgi:hypothetical protein